MLELATPWALMALPLPLMVWFLIPPSPAVFSSALKVPFFNAMSSLTAQQHLHTAISRLFIPMAIWASLVFALAGPRWIGEPLPMMHEGHNIMMVLDLSNSMDIEDMVLNGQPRSRLSIVKTAASQFVKDRVSDKIGLILFGNRAYLQTPLTYDRHNILMRIDDATAGLAGPMTSIGDALGLAVKRLEEVPEKGRIIILLTDGANNTGVLKPLKAAQLAQEDGIKVYTIGLGSESDIDDVFIPNASADLDEETLKKIAAITGGRYFRATDIDSLHSIYKTINAMETANQEHTPVRPQKEYYPWFIGMALLLCLILIIPGLYRFSDRGQS